MSTEKLYVVIKRGLFWRPEDKGYTAKIEEAGRYTKEEAESRCHGGEQPVTMALESEFQTTESIKAENSQLRTDLEAALKTASFRFDEWSKGQTELENSESRCAALAAECESLRADKERLDWLEANPAAIRERSVNKSWGRKVWWMGPTGDYDTAREAIDAAHPPATRETL